MHVQFPEGMPEASSAEATDHLSGAAGRDAAPPRLALTDVTKRFGANVALNGVNLELAPGEIHGLVGQNGSGKSTLVKALAGHFNVDEGALWIDGARAHFPVRVSELVKSRISFMHQDPGLLPGLSVRENICVGRFDRKRLTRAIAWSRQKDDVARVMALLGLDVDWRRPVSDLSQTDRALVAMARAFMPQVHHPGVVVLDEATRAIPGASLPTAHAAIRGLTHAGGSVIMISHNLAEVIAVADRVTVLRDGEVVVAGHPTNGLDEHSLARYVLGRNLPPDSSAISAVCAEYSPRANVIDLGGPGLQRLDLEVGAGEIVGLTGRPESGFEAVPYLLSGVQPADKGILVIDDDSLSIPASSIRRLYRAGVALIPEGRAEHGLALDETMADNVTLPYVRERGGRARIGSRWRESLVADAVDRFNIRPSDPSLLVRQFSGGNQQKVLLAKWLAGSPRLLILHEPTQAVDLGARVDILEAIRAEAHRGAAVILVSPEAADLSAVCARVVILERGVVKGTLVKPSAEQIVEAVYGVVS